MFVPFKSRKCELSRHYEGWQVVKTQMVGEKVSRAGARWRVFSAVVLLGLAAAPARAQHEEHQAVGYVARELLERPVPLRQGVGKIHQAVTTNSPQAQAFYDQGLAYLHSYGFIEAARSFNQALKLDANLAMAYIGLCDSYLGLQDVAAAHDAFAMAQALASDKLMEAERAQIEIRARQFDLLEGGADSQQKYFAYRNAINNALSANPTDPWLWILRGFADEGSPLGRGQSGGVDTIAFYERALALLPDNFVAHHYLAHTFGNLGRTKDSLEHAEAYARQAPAIPHAHHMIGHELRRLGRTDEAIAEFRKADELENAYFQAEKIPPADDWHHSHNLRLLALSYQTLGQMKLAEKMFREEFSLAAHGEMAEFNRSEWPQFLLNRGRTQEALEASQELMKSSFALGRFAGHTLAGRALLAMNQLPQAKEELGLAERESEEIPSAALGSLSYAGLLRAEILLRENKIEEGGSLMKDIEKGIRSVPGPDAWSEGLFQLESIAQAAREIGDWDLAEFTAKQMVEQDPSYAGGYYAVALAAEHRGNSSAARQQFATAEKLWSKADQDLPELQHIRQQLAASR